MFFNSFDGLPEILLRKMYDDVWKCIHCGSYDIKRYAYPGYDVIRGNYNEYKGAECNKCGARLEYLDERYYKLSMKEMEKRARIDRTMKSVWKKTPLWALDNGKEKE